MVWKTRYSVRWPIHMIQPRKMSLWDWKLGSVKTTATACKSGSRDGRSATRGETPGVLGRCRQTREARPWDWTSTIVNTGHPGASWRRVGALMGLVQSPPARSLADDW